MAYTECCLTHTPVHSEIFAKWESFVSVPSEVGSQILNTQTIYHSTYFSCIAEQNFYKDIHL